MESFYFPLFLVAVAIAVIWFFRRAGSRRRSGSLRVARSPAGRSVDGDRLRRDLDRRGPAVARTPLPDKSKDIWQTRRERVAKASLAETSAQSGPGAARAAHPLTQDRGRGRYELRDQNITQAEHLGIDEYLTKREREQAAREAEEAHGLSMTALKYEPADASSEAEKKRNKQAGFKP